MAREGVARRSLTIAKINNEENCRDISRVEGLEIMGLYERQFLYSLLRERRSRRFPDFRANRAAVWRSKRSLQCGRLLLLP